jgi:hypothetical protein
MRTHTCGELGRAAAAYNFLLIGLVQERDDAQPQHHEEDGEVAEPLWKPLTEKTMPELQYPDWRGLGRVSEKRENEPIVYGIRTSLMEI